MQKLSKTSSYFESIADETSGIPRTLSVRHAERFESLEVDVESLLFRGPDFQETD